jgi:hypothetical protein
VPLVFEMPPDQGVQISLVLGHYDRRHINSVLGLSRIPAGSSASVSYVNGIARRSQGNDRAVTKR